MAWGPDPWMFGTEFPDLSLFFEWYERLSERGWHDLLRAMPMQLQCKADYVKITPA